jgi:hypothetical protein
MKASEFRIGNLVCDPMHKLPFYIGLEDIADLCYDRPKRFEPIPLTKEWLLELGFEYNGVIYEIDEYLVRFTSQFIVAYWIDSGFMTKIKYVHQLQNLYFALTGQELKEIW